MPLSFQGAGHFPSPHLGAWHGSGCSIGLDKDASLTQAPANTKSTVTAGKTHSGTPTGADTVITTSIS